MPKELSIDETSDISICLTDLYSRFGITDDNDSIFFDKTKKNIKPMPIISDMYDTFSQYASLETVCKVLKSFVTGACANMNGQTNVDLTNKYIVFDIDESSMDKKMLPSFLYIATDCVYGLIKQNRMYHDTIFMDEVWKMMIYKTAAEQLGDMAKLIRGYGGSFIPITQDINAYINSSAGESILSNTDTKLILKLKENECKKIGNLLNLTVDEMNSIMKFQQGQGLLLAGSNRIYVNIVPTDKEDREFTTDPNKLKMYAEEKASEN